MTTEELENLKTMREAAERDIAYITGQIELAHRVPSQGLIGLSDFLGYPEEVVVLCIVDGVFSADRFLQLRRKSKGRNHGISST